MMLFCIVQTIEIAKNCYFTANKIKKAVTTDIDKGLSTLMTADTSSNENICQVIFIKTISWSTGLSVVTATMEHSN
jgi:hypothetical protein